MSFPEEFAEITSYKEPLAPFTLLRVGGPAEAMARPRSVEELARLLEHCRQHQVSYRLLGNGCNLLVRDEGVSGLVIRLSEPAFRQIGVTAPVPPSTKGRVRTGAGADVSAVISEAARHSLAGLESLIGIPGSVGGALRVNVGTRAGYIGETVRTIDVLDRQGKVQTIPRDEIDFNAPGGPFQDGVILAAEFELEHDSPDAILRRLRKTWIQRKATQPFSFQAYAKLFKEPRSGTADQLISEAGLVGTRVGGAEISERNANYLVAQPGTTARDVLRLIDVVRSKVQERTGQTLQLNIGVW